MHVERVRHGISSVFLLTNVLVNKPYLSLKMLGEGKENSVQRWVYLGFTMENFLTPCALRNDTL